MKRILTALLLALPGTLAAQTDSLLPLNRIRAVVGDKPIMQSTLLRQYGLYLGGRQRQMPDSATVEKELPEVLRQLIESEVLLQLLAVEKVVIPEEEVEQEVSNFLRGVRQGFPSEQAFIDTLKSNGFLSLEEFRTYQAENVRKQRAPQMLFRKLRSSGRLPAAVVPDSDVARYVPAQRTAAGRKPATVSFRQIIIATQPSAKAKEAARIKAESLVVLLHAGANFDSLARIVSMDADTKEKGGDLGWRRRGEFVPDFDRWVWALDPGRFSPVVATRHGYHIVKVEQKRPAQVQPRHILIRPILDSADVAIARTIADSVVTRLKAGVPFDSLVEKYNDKTVNPNPSFPNFNRDSLPPQYAQAFAGVAAGGVTAPFAIPDAVTGQPAFVVVLISAATEAADYTDAEINEMVRRRLQDGAAMAAYIEKMKKQMYIRIYP